MIKLRYKPLKIPLVINSRYDIRELADFEFHPGIDYGAPLGTPIHAVDNGYVAVTGNDASGYGLYVVLDHGHYCTLYAHLKGHILKIGQLIQAGDIVGYVGMTGMTTGPHLHFEVRDCPYSDKNFWLKSYLKGRHVMCIDPEKLVASAANIPLIKVDYTAWPGGTKENKGEVKDFGMKIVNQRNSTIEEPYCTNGCFFWYLDEAHTQTYPVSILFQDGVIYQAAANHLPYPQDTFIIFKDERVKMMKLKNLNELNLDLVRFAIGGVGIRNSLDPSFKYDPAASGFKGAFSDVLQKRNKTFLGYSAKEHKIYQMVKANIPHSSKYEYDAIELAKQSEIDVFMSVDGGSKSFLNNGDSQPFKGSGALINNIIGFNLK